MSLSIKAGTGGISHAVPEKKYMSRDEVLQAASDAIEYLHGRTCSGRQFKESDTDKARAAYLRVLIAAISAYGVLLRDEDLSSLEARIAALEAK